MHPGTSFPVGKVSFLDLYPFNFYEFLLAIGEKGLAEAIKNADISLLEPFRNKIIEYLKQYYFIGGIMQHMKSMAIVTNPLVNSYKRLVPGYEAPIYIA